MTNVQQLWLNIAAATAACCTILAFCASGSFLSFIVGLGYAAFFEYFYHRWIAHTNLFSLAAEKHREHHRVWRGLDAISYDRSRQHLNESWYFFPGALLAHFLIPLALGYTMPWPAILAFTLFYLQFEVFHWATHIEDNWIDGVLVEFPILWWLREQHIDWHLAHHDVPKSRYNFTPPYPGDYIFRTKE